MSSRIRPACAVLAVTLATGLAACVDAHKRFDEFTERVVDAEPPGIDGAGGLFDIDGEFLLAIVPSIAPNKTLRYAVTSDITIDGSSATLNLSFQPLVAAFCNEATAGEEVGDPLVASDLPVNEGGAFELAHDGAVVPADANDVLCADITANLVLNGLIKDANTFCGEVSGMVVTTGSSLDGSTFGAIRMDPGTRGDANLPEPLKACP